MKVIKILKIIILLLIFILALALGAKNHSVVSFDYLIAKSELSLSTLLGLVFLFAFAVVSLLYSGVYFKNRWLIIRLNKQVAKLQNQLDDQLQKNQADQTSSPQDHPITSQNTKEIEDISGSIKLRSINKESTQLENEVKK